MGNTMKKIAIIQSSYIPWKGYFDIISAVDEFVFFDSAQYTRRDWRNRNKIKTRQGLQWLTIPVLVKGKYSQPINQTMVMDGQWATKHWHAIHHAYARATFFREYEDFFKDLYLGKAASLKRLSEVNFLFISSICRLLGFSTLFRFCGEFQIRDGRNERLIDICKQSDAELYLSGPSARAYLDHELFRREGIELTFADYEDYPQYEQLHGPFEHHVSILDLIFNAGPHATDFMKLGGIIRASGGDL